MGDVGNIGKFGKNSGVDLNTVKGGLKKESMKTDEQKSIFEAIDTDKNGVLDDKEVQSFKENLDTSNDGVITTKEAKKFLKSLNLNDVDKKELLKFLLDYSLNIDDVQEVRIKEENGQKLVEVVYKNGQTEVVNHDKSSVVTSPPDEDGNVTVSHYTPDKKLTKTSTQASNGDIVETEYLEDGETPASTVTTAKNGSVSTVSYEEGKPVSKQVKHGSVTSNYTYSEDGTEVLESKVENEGVPTKERRIEYSYDQDGKTTANITEFGKSTVQTIVDNKVVSETITEQGKTTVRTHNEDGTTTENITTAEGSETIVYNDENKKLSKTKVIDGQEYTIEYDGQGNTVGIIVENGESPALIAKRFGCDVNELLELNKSQVKGKGKNRYFLVASEIKIPGEIEPDAKVLQNRQTKEEALAGYQVVADEIEAVNQEVAARKDITFTEKKFNTFEEIARNLFKQEGVENPSKRQLNARIADLKKDNPDLKDGELIGKKITAGVSQGRFNEVVKAENKREDAIAQKESAKAIYDDLMEAIDGWNDDDDIKEALSRIDNPVEMAEVERLLAAKGYKADSQYSIIEKFIDKELDDSDYLSETVQSWISNETLSGDIAIKAQARLAARLIIDGCDGMGTDVDDVKNGVRLIKNPKATGDPAVDNANAQKVYAEVNRIMSSHTSFGAGFKDLRDYLKGDITSAELKFVDGILAQNNAIAGEEKAAAVQSLVREAVEGGGTDIEELKQALMAVNSPEDRLAIEAELKAYCEEKGIKPQIEGQSYLQAVLYDECDTFFGVSTDHEEIRKFNEMMIEQGAYTEEEVAKLRAESAALQMLDGNLEDIQTAISTIKTPEEFANLEALLKTKNYEGVEGFLNKKFRSQVSRDKVLASLASNNLLPNDKASEVATRLLQNSDYNNRALGFASIRNAEVANAVDGALKEKGSSLESVLADFNKEKAENKTKARIWDGLAAGNYGLISSLFEHVSDEYRANTDMSDNLYLESDTPIELSETQIAAYEMTVKTLEDGLAQLKADYQAALDSQGVISDAVDKFCSAHNLGTTRDEIEARIEHEEETLRLLKLASQGKLTKISNGKTTPVTFEEIFTERQSAVISANGTSLESLSAIKNKNQVNFDVAKVEKVANKAQTIVAMDYAKDNIAVCWSGLDRGLKSNNNKELSVAIYDTLDKLSQMSGKEMNLSAYGYKLKDGVIVDKSGKPVPVAELKEIANQLKQGLSDVSSSLFGINIPANKSYDDVVELLEDGYEDKMEAFKQEYRDAFGQEATDEMIENYLSTINTGKMVVNVVGAIGAVIAAPFTGGGSLAVFVAAAGVSLGLNALEHSTDANGYTNSEWTSDAEQALWDGALAAIGFKVGAGADKLVTQGFKEGSNLAKIANNLMSKNRALVQKFGPNLSKESVEKATIWLSRAEATFGEVSSDTVQSIVQSYCMEGELNMESFVSGMVMSVAGNAAGHAFSAFGDVKALKKGADIDSPSPKPTPAGGDGSIDIDPHSPVTNPDGVIDDVIDDANIVVLPDNISGGVANNPAAQSTKFVQTHRVDVGESIVDGYRDGGRGAAFDLDGNIVDSSREIIVVDRTKDPKLQSIISDFKSKTTGMTDKQKAAFLQSYIHDMIGDGSLANNNLKAWEPDRVGKEVLLGDIVTNNPPIAVCRHRSLLYKILGDEVGLKVELQRGNFYSDGEGGGHAWNTVRFDDGSSAIFDAMHNKTSVTTPGQVDDYAKKYFTVEDQPLYNDGLTPLQTPKVEVEQPIIRAEDKDPVSKTTTVQSRPDIDVSSLPKSYLTMLDISLNTPTETIVANLKKQIPDLTNEEIKRLTSCIETLKNNDNLSQYGFCAGVFDFDVKFVHNIRERLNSNLEKQGIQLMDGIDYQKMASGGRDITKMTDVELTNYYQQMVPFINDAEIKCLIDQVHRIQNGEPRFLNTLEEGNLLKSIRFKQQWGLKFLKGVDIYNVVDIPTCPSANVPFVKKELTDIQYNALRGWTWSSADSSRIDSIYNDLAIELPEDTILYRGIQMASGGSKKVADYFNNIKVGAVIDNSERYISTAQNVETTFAYSSGGGDPSFGQNYVLKIKVPKGTKALDNRNYEGMSFDELILPPNKLRVTSIDYNTGVVECEYIPLDEVSAPKVSADSSVPHSPRGVDSHSPEMKTPASGVREAMDSMSEADIPSELKASWANCKTKFREAVDLLEDLQPKAALEKAKELATELAVVGKELTGVAKVRFNALMDRIENYFKTHNISEIFADVKAKINSTTDSVVQSKAYQQAAVSMKSAYDSIKAKDIPAKFKKVWEECGTHFNDLVKYVSSRDYSKAQVVARNVLVKLKQIAASAGTALKEKLSKLIDDVGNWLKNSFDMEAPTKSVVEFSPDAPRSSHPDLDMSSPKAHTNSILSSRNKDVQTDFLSSLKNEDGTPKFTAEQIRHIVEENPNGVVDSAVLYGLFKDVETIDEFSNALDTLNAISNPSELKFVKNMLGLETVDIKVDGTFGFSGKSTNIDALTIEQFLDVRRNSKLPEEDFDNYLKEFLTNPVYAKALVKDGGNISKVAIDAFAHFDNPYQLGAVHQFVTSAATIDDFKFVPNWDSLFSSVRSVEDVTTIGKFLKSSRIDDATDFNNILRIYNDILPRIKPENMDFAKEFLSTLASTNFKATYCENLFIAFQLAQGDVHLQKDLILKYLVNEDYDRLGFVFNHCSLISPTSKNPLLRHIARTGEVPFDADNINLVINVGLLTPGSEFNPMQLRAAEHIIENYPHGRFEALGFRDVIDSIKTEQDFNNLTKLLEFENLDTFTLVQALQDGITDPKKIELLVKNTSKLDKALVKDLKTNYKLQSETCENLAKLHTVSPTRYQKIVDSGLLDLIRDGKVSESILGNVSATTFLSNRTLKDVRKLANGEPLIPSIPKSEIEAISHHVANGDVCEADGVLFVNHNGKPVRLQISKEKFEELFPPLSSVSFEQGAVGDCWLISTLDNLMDLPNGRVQLYTMLRQDGDDIFVTFPKTGKSIKFENGEVAGAGSYLSNSHIANAPKGLQLIEQAYAVHRVRNSASLYADGEITDIQEILKSTDVETLMERLKSGNTSEAMTTISGEPNSRYFSIGDTPDQKRQSLTMIAEVANRDDILISFSTQANHMLGRRETNMSKKYDMVRQHAYSLKGYNSETGMLYVTNPWHSQVITEVPVYDFLKYANGITITKLDGSVVSFDVNGKLEDVVSSLDVDASSSSVDVDAPIVGSSFTDKVKRFFGMGGSKTNTNVDTNTTVSIVEGLPPELRDLRTRLLSSETPTNFDKNYFETWAKDNDLEVRYTSNGTIVEFYDQGKRVRRITEDSTKPGMVYDDRISYYDGNGNHIGGRLTYSWGKPIIYDVIDENTANVVTIDGSGNWINRETGLRVDYDPINPTNSAPIKPKVGGGTPKPEPVVSSKYSNKEIQYILSNSSVKIPEKVLDDFLNLDLPIDSRGTLPVDRLREVDLNTKRNILSMIGGEQDIKNLEAMLDLIKNKELDCPLLELSNIIFDASQNSVTGMDKLLKKAFSPSGIKVLGGERWQFYTSDFFAEVDTPVKCEVAQKLFDKVAEGNLTLKPRELFEILRSADSESALNNLDEVLKQNNLSSKEIVHGMIFGVQPKTINVPKVDPEIESQRLYDEYGIVKSHSAGLLRLAQVSPIRYEKIVNSGILDLIKEGKVKSEILENISSTTFFSDRTLKDIKRLVNGESVVTTLKADTDLSDISKYVDSGDVCELNGKLYVNDSGNPVELKISKEKFEELFPPLSSVSFSQGQLGDCWLVSTLDNMLDKSDSRVALFQLFEQQGNDILVKFPDSDKAIRFNDGMVLNAHSRQISTSSNPLAGILNLKNPLPPPVGVQMLEQAYAVHRLVGASNAYDVNSSITDIAQVADVNKLMDRLHGGQHYEFINDVYGADVTEEYSGTLSPLVLSQANNPSKALYFSTIVESSGQDVKLSPKYNILARHGYSIKGFNPNTGMVYITEPHKVATITEVPLTELAPYVGNLSVCHLDAPNTSKALNQGAGTKVYNHDANPVESAIGSNNSGIGSFGAFGNAGTPRLRQSAIQQQKDELFVQIDEQMDSVLGRMREIRRSTEASYNAKLDRLQTRQSELDIEFNEYNIQTRATIDQKRAEMQGLFEQIHDEKQLLEVLERQDRQLEQQFLEYKSALGDLEKKLELFEASKGRDGGTIDELYNYAPEQRRRTIGAEHTSNLTEKVIPEGAPAYFYDPDIAELFHTYNITAPQNKSKVVAELREKLSEITRKYEKNTANLNNCRNNIETMEAQRSGLSAEVVDLETAQAQRRVDYKAEKEAVAQELETTTSAKNSAVHTPEYETLNAQHKELQRLYREISASDGTDLPESIDVVKPQPEVKLSKTPEPVVEQNTPNVLEQPSSESVVKVEESTIEPEVAKSVENVDEQDNVLGILGETILDGADDVTTSSPALQVLSANDKDVISKIKDIDESVKPAVIEAYNEIGIRMSKGQLPSRDMMRQVVDDLAKKHGVDAEELSDSINDAMGKLDGWKYLARHRYFESAPGREVDLDLIVAFRIDKGLVSKPQLDASKDVLAELETRLINGEIPSSEMLDSVAKDIAAKHGTTAEDVLPIVQGTISKSNIKRLAQYFDYPLDKNTKAMQDGLLPIDREIVRLRETNAQTGKVEAKSEQPVTQQSQPQTQEHTSFADRFARRQELRQDVRPQPQQASQNQNNGIGSFSSFGATRQVETPTRPVETPTRPVETPTRPVETPTRSVETPTKPVETSAKSVDTPTHPASQSSNNGIGSFGDVRSSMDRPVQTRPITEDEIHSEMSKIIARNREITKGIERSYDVKLDRLQTRQSELDVEFNEYNIQTRATIDQKRAEMQGLFEQIHDEKQLLEVLERQDRQLEQQFLEYKSALGDLEKKLELFEASKGRDGGTIDELYNYAPEQRRRTIGAEHTSNLTEKVIPEGAPAYFYDPDIAELFHTYNITAPQNKSKVVAELREKLSEITRKYEKNTANLNNCRNNIETMEAQRSGLSAEVVDLESAQAQRRVDYKAEKDATAQDIENASLAKEQALNDAKNSPELAKNSARFKELQRQLRGEIPLEEVSISQIRNLEMSDGAVSSVKGNVESAGAVSTKAPDKTIIDPTLEDYRNKVINNPKAIPVVKSYFEQVQDINDIKYFVARRDNYIKSATQKNLVFLNSLTTAEDFKVFNDLMELSQSAGFNPFASVKFYARIKKNPASAARFQAMIELAKDGTIDPLMLKSYPNGVFDVRVARDVDILINAKRQNLSTDQVKDLYIPKFDRMTVEQLKSVPTGGVIEYKGDLVIKIGDAKLQKINMSRDSYFELFPPAHYVKQQQAGKCYLYSTILTALENPQAKAKLLNQCFSEHDGVLTVKMPGSKVSFDAPLDNITGAVKDSPYYSKGCTGVNLLEQAYEQNEVYIQSQRMIDFLTKKIAENDPDIDMDKAMAVLDDLTNNPANPNYVLANPMALEHAGRFEINDMITINESKSNQITRSMLSNTDDLDNARLFYGIFEGDAGYSSLKFDFGYNPLNPKSTGYKLYLNNPETGAQLISDDMLLKTQGCLMVAATGQLPSGSVESTIDSDFGILSSHAYACSLKMINDKPFMKLINPHNSACPILLTLEQFRKYFVSTTINSVM